MGSNELKLSRRKLSKLELAGLLALQDGVNRAQVAFEEGFACLGLDPSKQYKVEDDGTIHPIEDKET